MFRLSLSLLTNHPTLSGGEEYMNPKISTLAEWLAFSLLSLCAIAISILLIKMCLTLAFL